MLDNAVTQKIANLKALFICIVITYPFVKNRNHLSV